MQTANVAFSVALDDECLHAAVTYAAAKARPRRRRKSVWLKAAHAVMETPKRVVATVLATVPLTSGFTVSAAAKDVLCVQNTTSGDVSIVDPVALNVVGTIPVGLYPDDVVSSPDGRWIYVNRIDSAGIPGAPAVGDTGEVVAISTATNQIVWRMRTDGMPHHMTVSPDGTKIFVGSMFGDDVTIYDVATQKPVGHIPFASGVRPFAITADQKTMYVQRSDCARSKEAPWSSVSPSRMTNLAS